MATAKKARAAGPGRKAPASKTSASGQPAQAPASGASALAVPQLHPRPTPSRTSPSGPSWCATASPFPKAEYAVLQELKQRSAKLGRPAKKSEVLRAGVNALAAMGDAAFTAAIATVPALKTGRPSKT